jgi:hypothetical protein
MKRLNSIIQSLAIIIVGSSIAWAIEGSTNIDVSNGVISLTGTVPVANGGTNVTAATDTYVLVGNGTTWVATDVPNCNGANEALNFSDGSPNTFSCATISAGSTINPEITFSTETAIDLDSGGTSEIFIGLNGKVSTTDDNVMVPMGAGSYSNFRCISSTAAGNITVEVGVGTCGSALTYGTLAQIVNGTTAPSVDTDSQSVTAGQCVAVRASTAINPTSTHISCSFQKTA